MLGKKGSFIEVNRVGLFAGNRHLQSYTTLHIFMPAHILFTHASAPAHCKSEGNRHTYTHRCRNMPALKWSCHREDMESWVARDKGWGERGLERGAAEMKEPSILSVLAGLPATVSHQRSLSVTWHRLWIREVALEGCSPTFLRKKFHHLGKKGSGTGTKHSIWLN